MLFFIMSNEPNISFASPIYFLFNFHYFFSLLTVKRSDFDTQGKVRHKEITKTSWHKPKEEENEDWQSAKLKRDFFFLLLSEEKLWQKSQGQNGVKTVSSLDLESEEGKVKNLPGEESYHLEFNIFKSDCFMSEHFSVWGFLLSLVSARLEQTQSLVELSEGMNVQSMWYMSFMSIREAKVVEEAAGFIPTAAGFCGREILLQVEKISSFVWWHQKFVQ